jgi:hypothetical protein
VNAAVLPGTVLGDALNATVVDSANASFLNAAQSPGLQFSGTDPSARGRSGVHVSSSCGITARKVPLSKGAKYTNSVRHSLTPSPTKFGSGGLRSPDRTTVAGVASASRATAEAASKRAVNFGEDRPLSEKYASGPAHEDYRGSQRVPESPPPPPPRGTKPDSAKWGALTESLRRQVGDFHCSHCPELDREHDIHPLGRGLRKAQVLVHAHASRALHRGRLSGHCALGHEPEARGECARCRREHHAVRQRA